MRRAFLSNSRRSTGADRRLSGCEEWAASALLQTRRWDGGCGGHGAVRASNDGERVRASDAYADGAAGCGAMALLKGWRNTRARVWAAGEAASP